MPSDDADPLRGSAQATARWFEASLDALPSQVCLLDAGGAIAWVNAAWDRFGRANGLPEDYGHVGQDYLAIAEAEAPEIRAGIEAVLAGELEAYETEYPCHAPDRERWFRLRVSRVTDGDKVRAVVVHDDITEVRSEKRLLEDAQRALELLAENLDPLLWIVSPDLEEMLFTSPGADAFWGLPEGTLSRDVMAWTSLVHPEDQDRVVTQIQADLAELLEGGDPEGTYTFRLENGGDGPPRWVQLKTGPVRAADGSLEAIVGITEDISRAKHAEQALAESEARFRQLAENVEDIFWVADADSGRLEYINQAFERWTGVPADEVYDHPDAWMDTIHPDDRERMAGGAVDPTAPSTIHRIRVRMGPPGSWHIEALVQFRPVEAREGQPDRIVGVVHDITDAVEVARAQAERARLEARQEELAQLAWVTSHDLVTPLRQVTSFSQLLQRQAGDTLGDAERESLGYVLEGTAKLEALVGNLRRYAEIVSSDDPHTRAEMGPLWERALEPLAARLEEAEATVESDPLPEVVVNEDQIVRLLRELVTNTLRFRRLGTPLELSLGVERAGDRWRFELTDNGRGFDPAYEDKIFALFQQLDPGLDDEGTGLGLTVCKRIVENHGGSIWATGEPGSGATISFTLPAPEPAASR